jgi:hypothetical protein
VLYPVPYAVRTQLLPLLGRLLPAGFPSPADDYLDGEIDLATYPGLFTMSAAPGASH